MLSRYRFFFQFLVVIFFSVQASAQTSSSSPYSRYGIGDLQFNGFTKNLGMGGVSYGYNPTYNLNITNPASLSSLTLTTYEMAVNMDQIQLKTTSKTQNINDVSLSYFALGFPIVDKKWGAAFGIAPYSNVGYSVNDVQTNADGDRELHTYQGSGGLSQFFISNGFSPFKHFSIGANASYLFGAVNQERRIEYAPLLNYFNTRITEETSIGNIYLNFGMQYTFDSLRIASHDSLKINQKKWSLTLGITGSPATSLNAKHTTLTENFLYNAFNNVVVRDTIEYVHNQAGSIKLPLSLGFGMMLKQGSRWLIGSDFSVQNWENYTEFGENDSLGNSWRIAAGAQLHPKPTANDMIDKKIPYWEKIQYRFGFHYSQTYLIVHDTQLKEYGLSVGFGLPIKRSLAMIHFAAEVGRRGTTSNNLIEENYLKLSLGFTINDRWFIKSKYY